MKHRLLILVYLLVILCCEKNHDMDNLQNPTTIAEDGEVEVVFESNVSKGVNVVFIGDGFTKEQLGKINGDYRQNAIMHFNYLFGKPPFSEYKGFFNAYIVYAESKDGNISFEGEPRKDTAFGSVNNGNNYISGYNEEKLHQYVANAVLGHTKRNTDTLILFSLKGSNAGQGWGGLAIFDSDRPSSMLHEVGHAFASLGDEYEIDGGTPIETDGFANLDSTNDLEQIKWRHFIGLKDYVQVGAFGGGGNAAFGIWRPEMNSIMRGSFPGFNAPSREAIVKRIFEISERTYSFHDFLRKDVITNSTSMSIMGFDAEPPFCYHLKP